MRRQGHAASAEHRYALPVALETTHPAQPNVRTWMPARKPFLLRSDPNVLAALQRWATDELRSVNGQINYLLRRALRQAGRLSDGEPPGTCRVRSPKRHQRIRRRSRQIPATHRR